MIHIGRLSPFNQWDQTMLDALLCNQLYPTGLEFRRSDGYPNSEGCILIIPGRYWQFHGPGISEAIAPYRWVLAVRTGDEEDLFDITTVRHPNVKWWAQTPRTGRDYRDARLFGVGYTPHFKQLPAEPPAKINDVFLAGQDTNDRRHECFQALAGRENVHPTWGFTKGMHPKNYTENMLAAKVAPCPSGPATPDTFRLFEALEAHCVPIGDDVTPAYDSRGYWETLFPGAPFPILTDYGSLPGYIDEALKGWPANSNRISAWWMRQKRSMAHWLVEDLEKLGAL
jgi:hypothetical protein